MFSAQKFVYSLHGSVESRSRMYRDRLLLMQQRLLRSEEFCLRGMSSAASALGKYEVNFG